MANLFELLFKGGKQLLASIMRHLNTWEEWITFGCSVMAVVLLVHMTILYFSGKD